MDCEDDGYQEETRARGIPMNEIAVAVESIINNQLEEAGVTVPEDMTHGELVALVNRIADYVATR